MPVDFTDGEELKNNQVLLRRVSQIIAFLLLIIKGMPYGWLVYLLWLSSLRTIRRMNGKRILLTGDYRMHGFRADKMEKTFREMGHIDLMITEGTNLTKEYKGEYQNEKDIERKFKDLKEKYGSG